MMISKEKAKDIAKELEFLGCLCRKNARGAFDTGDTMLSCKDFQEFVID